MWLWGGGEYIDFNLTERRIRNTYYIKRYASQVDSTYIMLRKTYVDGKDK